MALQWHDGYNENVLAFTNTVFNRDGGTHLSGFRAALTRTVNAYAQAQNLLKDMKENLSGEDVREGLTAILAVKIHEPRFSSQTKDKLVSCRRQGLGRVGGQRHASPPTSRRTRRSPSGSSASASRRRGRARRRARRAS